VFNFDVVGWVTGKVLKGTGINAVKQSAATISGVVVLKGCSRKLQLSDRRLQISDRRDMGAQNFNFCR